MAVLSVSSENISCVYLVGYIIETAVITISDDSSGHELEFPQIVDYKATEESLAILQCRLIDDHSRPLCLDTLHKALNRGLTEVIGIRFHGKAVNTDYYLLFR